MLAPMASAITRTGTRCSFGKISRRKIHAVERSVITPRGESSALLRGCRDSAALNVGRLRGIVADCV